MNDNITSGNINSPFETGSKNDAFAEYFTGTSYLNILSDRQVTIANVTFEPGCRNNWHIHHASRGGGQILLCIDGTGYYQEWGCKPVKLKKGRCCKYPRRS